MSINKKVFQGGASGITLSEHYKVLTYTGSGTAIGQSRSITGVGFSPDAVLLIRYQTSGNETMYWFTRKHTVTSEGEVYYTKFNEDANQDVGGGHITGWLSDGFKVGYIPDGSGDTWIAFCWKIGGNTGNPDVNLDSMVSLREFTGNGTYRNISHGLGVSDVYPVVKNITSSYPVVGRPIGTSWTDYCKWTSNPSGGFVDDFFTWQDTSSTSTNVRIGARPWVNQSSQTIFMWTFAPVAGASAYGTYTGNGSSSSGPTVDVGFQPSLVIGGTAKEGQTTATWLFSNRHLGGNTNLRYKLFSNSSWANSNANANFTSTGFQINSSFSTWNASGDSYWYFAWADPDIVG